MEQENLEGEKLARRQKILGVAVSMGIVLGASLGSYWDKTGHGIALGMLLGVAIASFIQCVGETSDADNKGRDMK